MSPAMQVKLLRVIQKGGAAAGEHQAGKIDVRFVAATNRDVQAGEQGGFRRICTSASTSSPSPSPRAGQTCPLTHYFWRSTPR
jgi:transcriptional regulator of acetoin/glycerol metabolism